jgi:hypothetical protein
MRNSLGYETEAQGEMFDREKKEVKILMRLSL